MLLNTLCSPGLSPLATRLLHIQADDEDPDAGGGVGLSEASTEADPDADSRETEDEAKTVAEVEDEKAEGVDYKKRFSDTKADRDRLKQELDSLRQEVAEMRRQGHRTEDTPGREQPNADDEIRAMARQESQAIVSEARRRFFALPKLQQTNDAWIDIESEVRTERDIRRQRDISEKVSTRALSESELREKGRAEGRKMAVAALEERGIPGEQGFKLLRAEIAAQLETDPSWFEGRSAEQQYADLADRVKATVEAFTKPDPEKVKEANAERRKEAAGVLPKGTTRRAPSPGPKDDPAEPETMTANMQQARQLNRERAAALSGRAGR